MLALEDVRKREVAHWRRDDRPGEADAVQNRLSRALIRAMRRERGRAFLVWINPPVSGGETFTAPYARGMVWNFGADAIVPCVSRRLTAALRAYRARPSSATIGAVSVEIAKVGGEHLVWS